MRLLHTTPNTYLVAGLLVLLPFAAFALVPWVITAANPTAIQSNPLQPPGGAHPLGTDELGRDLLARVIYATRGDLLISLVATLLSCVIGCTVGFLAGYQRGWLDAIVMRIVEVVLSFPSIVLALLLIAAFGRIAAVEVLAITILFSPWYVRMARGLALALRERGYVEASQLAGAGALHVTWRHIVPNSATTLIVGTSLTAAAALILASSLSYLGLGVQPPDPSWGNMLHDSFQFLIIAPWYGVVPGVCIAVVAIGYSWLGDGVEHALGLHGDPHAGSAAAVRDDLVRPA